jgi:restriction endonuclease Mrr
LAGKPQNLNLVNLNALHFRKRREISPHYEASMQEMNVKPEDNKKETPYDQQDTRIENNNNESPQEDLEAIWKVMSTFHE